MRVGSLFSGYDGLGMGLASVFPDARAEWFVEFDKAPSRVLAHRWPDVPNLGDITETDWESVPPIDILTGGFPCQDVSHAGLRKGMKPGTRSGLWEHFAYAIDVLRPRVVIIENVRGLLSARTEGSEEVVRTGPKGGRKVELTRRALGRVLWDLADLGFDAQWCGIRASDVGAPHGRFRVFILAQPASYAGRIGAQVPNQRGVAAVQVAGGDGTSRGPVGESLTLLPTPVGTDSLGARNATAKRPEGSRHHAGTTLTDTIWLGQMNEAKFGVYAPAIARWESVLGRPAPSPTEPGRDDRPRLSPRFVEWMMGLPEGHVTDPAIGLTRSQQLKILGNGVVPMQAAAAIAHMTFGTPIGVGPSVTASP